MDDLSTRANLGQPADIPSDRRSFVRRGAALLVLPMLSACERAATITTPIDPAPVSPDTYAIDGNDVVVTLGRIPALSADNRAVVLLSARVIVVRVAAESFRAFSVECPHAGCGVSIVDGQRLLCPCHGSAFDFAGQRLEGPAPRGLTPLPAALDVRANTLRVRRG